MFNVLFYKSDENGKLHFSDSNLISLKNGDYKFYNKPIISFYNDLSSLADGKFMFYNCTALTSFGSDLSSLTNGYSMFDNCYNLTEFDSDLSSLTKGYDMFSNCRNLKTFSSDLSSIINGEGMFSFCSNLTTFTSDLSSLTNGWGMFRGCSNLKTFSSDLSSLTDSGRMFESCRNLTTFTSNLSSLTSGLYMFENCENLTSFTSDLSSLTNGYYMFYGCKLTTKSLMYIAESINTVTNKPSIHIGIGNTTPTEEETELLTEIHNKGWQVYVNGDKNSNIFNPAALIPTDEEMPQIIPFYAKPEEVSEEDAEYIGEDGKYYIILGGQFIFVDDPDTYGMFTSLEDAAAQMRLTKIGEEEIETA